MPSGARKRKAAKKKMKNGDAYNSNHHQDSSNSSSTHSQGSDDPKSFDDRESDNGDVEREVEEKGVAGGEGEAVDYEEGGCENGKGLSEEIFEIAREAIAGVWGEAKDEENGSVDVDYSAVDIAKETPIGVLTSEDSVPSNGHVQDKEVAIEEEESMIAELEELKGQYVPSILESIPGDEIPKSVDEGTSVELGKDVAVVPQEIDAGFGSLLTSDMVESKLIGKAEASLQLLDEKGKFSSFINNLQPGKTETKITSMDEEKPLVDPPVDASIVEDTAKVLEIFKQAEELVVAPGATATQMVDSIRNGETLKQSDDQVGSIVVTTSREVDNFKGMETQKLSMVEGVNNGETFKQSDDQIGSTVVTTNCEVDNVKEMVTQKWSVVEGVENGVSLKQSDDQVSSTVASTTCEVDNVKEMETQKRSMVESVENRESHKQSDDQVGSMVIITSSEVDNVKEVETRIRSMDQSSVGSNPLPVRRTSWVSCCGLLELFSGANR